MNTLNDALAHHVFKAMAVHRPQLAALADLGDDDGDVDIRLIGDQIIRNFPWPIGIEVRRLLSGSMREPDRRRLDQLFRTFERSVQFLAFVMLAQLWKARKEKPFPLPASFVNEFQRRAPLVSLGNLTWMVRQIGRVWKTTDSAWFVTEIGPLVTDKFCDELDGWVPERNEMGHYQVNLTGEEVQRRCVMANERIISLLTKIAFFSKYKLVSLRDIKAQKGKYPPAIFDHGIDVLTGGDPSNESNAVLLLKNSKNAEECINLSPFVIDTHGERIDTLEKPELRKDVFLFSKFRQGGLFYSGAEATERSDLRALSNYAELVAEFEDMMATMKDQR